MRGQETNEVSEIALERNINLPHEGSGENGFVSGKPAGSQSTFPMRGQE